MLQKAEYLVLQTRYDSSRDDYYQTLKELTAPTEWQDTVEHLLAAAEKFRNFDNFIARLMKEHEMWERLFNYCKKESMNEIHAFENDLKPHFGKEILEMYRKQKMERTVIQLINQLVEIRQKIAEEKLKKSLNATLKGFLSINTR